MEWECTFLLNQTLCVVGTASGRVCDVLCVPNPVFLNGVGVYFVALLHYHSGSADCITLD